MTVEQTSAVRRLNWGCGTHPEPGWINSDRKTAPGIDISCDIRQGLPIADASLDYIVSIHALQELPYPDLVPALSELHRVLRPGGVVRLGLPDLDKAPHTVAAIATSSSFPTMTCGASAAS